MKFNYSDINDFLECRTRWNYHSSKRQNLEPEVFNYDLVFGSLIHTALEAFHGNGADIVDSFQAAYYAQYNELIAPLAPEKQELMHRDIFELGTGMLRHYLEWHRGLDPLDYRTCEYVFEVPIPGTDDTYKGRIDALADYNGKLYIVEYKTKNTLPEPGHLALNVQSALYQWAIREQIRAGLLTGEIAGVIYIMLRKAIPEIPKLVDKGSRLTKAITRSTSYDIYMQAIVDHGFNPADYEEHLQKLTAQGNTFFRRDIYERYDIELDRTGDWLYAVTREMARPDLSVFPSISWNCTRCAFKAPCAARMNGTDEQYLLDTFYRPRTQPEQAHPVPSA